MSVSARAAPIALSLLCLLPLPHVVAQSLEVAPIATDRPSVGTAPDITAARSFQIESGMNFAYSSRGHAADLPETLLRYRAGHHVELRFNSTNLIRPMDMSAGWPPMQAQDMAFGMKLGISPPNHMLPQTIVASLGVPTGSAAQSSGSYDPQAIAIWQQALRHGFAITEEVGFFRTLIDGKRQNNWNPSLFVSRAISGRLGWFAEYAPTTAANTATLHVVDGGFLFTPAPVSQIDVRVGYRNDPAGLHNLMSLGYSIRIDRLGRRFPVVR
jgi:hypothetical protein